MGEEGRKGELFGLVNMFTFQGDGGPGGLLVKEVVNKTNVAEGRMGVKVIGYEAAEADNEEEDEFFKAEVMDSGDEEEDGFSQLEALDGAKRKRKQKSGDGGSGKSNPVQAILAAAGVQYTHENSEVLGSSAIEAKLSKRAVEADTRCLSGDTTAFGSGEGGSKNGAKVEEDNGISAIGEGEDAVDLNGVTYRFHPPEDVRRRQFCEMSKAFGFGSVTEFALVVEGWTPRQRGKALERFYRILRERGLEGLRQGKGVSEVEVEEEGKVENKKEEKQGVDSREVVGGEANGNKEKWDGNGGNSEMDSREKEAAERSEKQEQDKDEENDNDIGEGEDEDGDQEL